MYVCMYVCIWFFSIVATPFNLDSDSESATQNLELEHFADAV